MLHTFSNIAIGLMVDIGGGAVRPKHDIRLGDIVVGSPGYGNGGVLQYDYSKAVQGAGLTTTGHLNQPPASPLTAMPALKAQYQHPSHKIQAAVDTVLEANPGLRVKYGKPDAGTGKLYGLSYVHVGGEDDDGATTCS
ncbi:hypothetical protein JX266_014489, partial [Neoarthrinium moseri]